MTDQPILFPHERSQLAYLTARTYRRGGSTLLEMKQAVLNMQPGIPPEAVELMLMAIDAYVDTGLEEEEEDVL